MTDVDLSALDRELKKGAAELLLLSVLEARPLVVAAVVATLLPARRAASIDPTKALQQE